MTVCEVPATAGSSTSRQALQIHAQSVLELFLSGHKPTTVEAYRRDLERFTEFMGAPDAHAATEALLTGGHGNANSITLRYRNAMLDSGLAPATVNRRLSAVRSLVSVARQVGRIAWSVDIPGVKRAPVRDTRGPGLGAVQQMLGHLASLPDSPKKIRDIALVRLLADMALRRGEVVGLDRGHFDGERLQVLGKGRSEREPVTVPRITRAALQAWLEIHDGQTLAMFFALDNVNRGHRLTGTSLWRMIGKLAADAGVEARVWPHALRHHAVTTALDITSGDVRNVRQFSRHVALDMVLAYDDNRRDEGGRIGDLVAATNGAAVDPE